MKQFIKLFIILLLVSLFKETSAQYQSRINQDNVLSNYALANGHGVFFNIDALIWKSLHEDLEYTVMANINNNLFNRHRITPKGNYTGGFRVGAGYIFPSHEQWDIYGYYTQFNNNASGKSCINSQQTPLNLLTNDTSNIVQMQPIDQAVSCWNLHLKLADLEIGKAFVIDNFLRLRPHIGLRGGQINQKNIVTYSGGTSLINRSPDIIIAKTNFAGIGIQGGINSQWDLFDRWCKLSGLSVYGDFAVAFLGGNIKISNIETLNSQPYLQIYKCHSIIQPIIDLALGVRWNQNLNQDRINLCLQLGWEQHWISKAWHIIRNNLITPGLDLFVAGITISARIDF